MRCPCCGSVRFSLANVLSPELIAAWRLSPDEAVYIQRQQGTTCSDCGCSLRGMALGQGILTAFGLEGPLRRFPQEVPPFRSILEINGADRVGQFLGRRTLTEYPEVDMQHLPFPDEWFDLVVHSDTLEHVEFPVQGLKECYRVLRHGAPLVFTVPIVVERLTGIPQVLYGHVGCLVHTEFGADVWKGVILAGFNRCEFVVLEYPAAIAIVARKD